MTSFCWIASKLAFVIFLKIRVRRFSLYPKDFFPSKNICKIPRWLIFVLYCPFTFFRKKGQLLKISSCVTLVNTIFNFSISPIDRSGTSKLPVELPINILYCCLQTVISYYDRPPEKAPLLPPPEITKAFIPFIDYNKLNMDSRNRFKLQLLSFKSLKYNFT